MRVAILGAGRTGAFVARALSEEHDVVLIDKDPKVLEQVSRLADVATVLRKAPTVRLFEDLAEDMPDLFFAATADDETNLVSCSMAKNLNFPKTVARVTSSDYLNHAKLDFGRLFFVDHFIGAEVLAAQDLFNSIVHAEDVAVQHFAHGAIQMRTLLIPETWDQSHTPIRELKFPDSLIVVLIRRKEVDRESIIIPHGEDHILPGDEVTVVGEAKVMRTLHDIFHVAEHKVRSVILVGGTPIAVNLARLLAQQKINVRIIESDETRCHQLADILHDAMIINRDGRDPQLYLSERIQDVSALVSCLHHDGTNLLIAAMAKRYECPQAIALINRPDYAPILEALKVTPALSAQVNVTHRILSLLHEETILSIASPHCEEAKIIEMKIPASSSIVGIPLSELSKKFPKDFLIAVIESRGKVMIGKGNRILSPADTVIAICHPHHIPQIPQLLA